MLEKLLSLARETLPSSDVATVPEAVLKSFARHGAFLRQNSPFCREVSEAIFLHYVFYPRINTEDLVDCRPFFYEQLWPLVEGLTDVEAALEVNRWCAAQMTYESTDGRTINPLTAYSCGLGRCGEESVFAVTVFRSVGIPARQVYVPWWSHCDDNHAWVEVYVGGRWHFLGACEPEPILDRGWFTSAATRAMVALSRTFFDLGLEEQIINREGCCLHLNQISRYAESRPLTVTVVDRGRPVPGARVTLSVLNMADLGEIAGLETDEKGQISLDTGLGSLLVEARLEEKYAFAHINTQEDRVLTLDLAAQLPGSLDLDFIAPQAGTRNRTTLTKAQQREKLAVLAQAKGQREARISGYFLPEYAAAPEAVQAMLRQAGGNAPAIWQVYQAGGLALLETLAPKDYRDARADVLLSFLGMAQGPRIGLEKLSPWRQPLLEALTEAQQAHFRGNPAAIWDWILTNFPRAGRFYPALWLQPEGALALGAADEQGRKLLYVAICRSLGLGADLESGPWCPEPDCDLEIAGELPYFVSWTLARWEQGWRTLEVPGKRLPQGRYRLITTNRLPNGNQLAHMEIFDLEGDKTVALTLRQGTRQQMLAHYPVALGKDALSLRLYLEVGAEPTEHALNELLEVGTPRIPVKLYIRDAKDARDPTLQKVLGRVPGVTLELCDFEDGSLETLARSLYLEPGVWPLLVLTDGETGYYGHCGYGVNTVPLALGLAT